VANRCVIAAGSNSRQRINTHRGISASFGNAHERFKANRRIIGADCQI
jgi:hypothetical protein